MSEPLNVFQQTRKHIKTGNFSFLSSQVLMLTGENQALVSQLAYLQKQYIAQLSQIHELKELNKIQVRLRHPSQTALAPEKPPKSLSPETQDMLRNAADFVL